MTDRFRASLRAPKGEPLAATGCSDTALQVREVSVSLGGTQILRSASFQAPRGRLALLTGRSGAGKSTLLNAAAGLLPIDSGVIRLGDHDLTIPSSSLRRRIGIVYQDPLLLTDLTVIDNVLWVARIRGLSASDAREQSEVALSQVGLSALVTRKVHHLSGGEAQRVAIARAIVGDPLMVIGDEPTSALDSANSEAVANLLATLASRLACPVVVASHDPILAARSDVVFEICDGVAAEVVA